MASKIIFLTVGNGSYNLVSSLAAFSTRCLTFNKSIVSLFNGSTPTSVLFERSLIFRFTFPLLAYYETFLIPRWCFSSLQSLATDFEGRPLLSKVSRTLHLSISLTSTLVHLPGLYFLKTLMASVAVTTASNVRCALQIPWFDFLPTIHWST